MDRQYNDQKKHGHAIQRPKETWTGNITTKRNMDRQYNFQKKHGQTIQRPKETWTVHVSFGRCIACPCFFWSLYCLSMFLLVVLLSVQKKHGQAIQRPKETWTGNTMIKRNIVEKYNDQKKHEQTIQRPKAMFLLVVVLPVLFSFGRCIVCPCSFWSLYCLSLLPLDNTTAKRNMDRQYNY
jgi:hypothetical protein